MWITPRLVEAILGIYALMLGVGGVQGFVKKGSKASLIAGLISAIVAIFAALLISMSESRYGAILGLVLSLVMFIMFGRRYAASKKIIPAGLIVALSFFVMLFSLLFLIGV